MKKLSFILVGFALSMAMVFGQQPNTVNVTQGGNNNTADVSQTTMGATNFLNFWQNGSNNLLTAVQSNTSLDSKNYSYGEQNGNSNTANITQDGYKNESYLHQNGDGNTITLKQFKSGETALTPDVTNTAENTQWGSNNTYTLDQIGHLNTQSLWQYKSGNKAEIDQSATFSKNYSYMWQNGDNNKVDLDQKALRETAPDYGTNYSELVQNGNGNVRNLAVITQVGSNPSNTSILKQDGYTDETYLYQQTWNANLSNNTAAGNSNYLKVIQDNPHGSIPAGW